VVAILWRAALNVSVALGIISRVSQQEGQHPLTGHRAANFRLLVNQ